MCALRVATYNDVKVYNVTASKVKPLWELARTKRRALKKKQAEGECVPVFLPLSHGGVNVCRHALNLTSVDNQFVCWHVCVNVCCDDIL